MVKKCWKMKRLSNIQKNDSPIVFSCYFVILLGGWGKNIFSPYFLRNDTVMADSCRQKVLLTHHCTNHHFDHYSHLGMCHTLCFYYTPLSSPPCWRIFGLLPVFFSPFFCTASHMYMSAMYSTRYLPKKGENKNSPKNTNKYKGRRS